MHPMRYMFALLLEENQISLTPSEVHVLAAFAYSDLTSVYMIYRSPYNYHKIAYKNVHKKAKKLLNLHLIEPVKENEKHGAIYYRLTSLGLFYMITRSRLLINFIDLIRTYSKDELFKIFLYPYFEKHTILSLNSKRVKNVIFDHFREGLASVCSYLIDILQSRQTMIDVFRWSMIPSNDSTKNADVIEYLRIRFDLDWLPKNARFEKSSDKKELKITYGSTCLTLELNEGEQSSAILKVNKEIIFEFAALPVGNDMVICEHVISSEEELVNEYGPSFFATVHRHWQDLSFTLISLEENYDYDTAGSFYPAEKWMKKQEKENFLQDINLIKNDKKFLLLCKNFYEIFEKYKAYFEKASQMTNSVIK